MTVLVVAVVFIVTFISGIYRYLKGSQQILKQGSAELFCGPMSSEYDVENLIFLQISYFGYQKARDC